MPIVTKQKGPGVATKPIAPVSKTPTSKPSVTSNKKVSVLDRISSIGFDDDDGIKVLLYGMSGSGKTSLWSTFPSPILSLICSGSDKPGELRSVDTPENRKRIQQVVITDPKEVREVTQAIQQGDIEFNTVVLDHATGFQDLILKHILGLDELPAQKSWGLATRDDWGKVAIQAKELLRGLLSLPCNVVIVAQEKTFSSEESSDIIMPSVGAGLTPSLTGWLNTAVEYIVQTFKRQKEEVTTTKVGNKEVKVRTKVDGVDYCLRTGPHSVFQTKFRMPKGKNPLPEFITDPDYDKIMALIRGE